MLKYILKRLGAGLVSVFVLVTITFFLMHAIPGGPFSPAEERNVPEKVLEQIADKYGLNDPVPVQYVKYLGNLLKGDMGVSFKRQDTTVNELIANGFPVSAKVGAWGVALALAAGIPLGIVAGEASRRGFHGVCHHRRIGAQLCGLRADDVFVLREVEAVPFLRAYILAALCAAGVLHGIFPDRLYYKAYALQHAGNHAPGLYPY